MTSYPSRRSSALAHAPGEVGVVHEAGDLLAGVPLHALHEVDEPFGRPGHGPAGVYNIEHGEAALGQRVEVLAVPAQGRGPGGVAAHVKDDGVPVKGKGGRDLRGQGRASRRWSGRSSGRQGVSPWT